MRVARRVLPSTVLLIAALLLGLTGRRAAFGADVPGATAGRIEAAQQFYTRVLGEWVGTAVSRLNDAQPVTGYFHLAISRVDDHTFREEYTFYRVHPRTGALERSGTQSILSSIDSRAVIHQACRGKGTILIDLRPKNQSFEASGEAHFTLPDHLESAASGTITVEGMPLNLGKHGQLRKATAAWSLEGGELVGQTRVETKFRAWLFAKRFRFETQLRARRGADVQAVAGRAPAVSRRDDKPMVRG